MLELTALCERLFGVGRVHIPDETYAHAARVVTLARDGPTARTAGGWLVSAVRHALIAALDRTDADAAERGIVIAPDALPIPATTLRPLRPPGPPDRDGGGWEPGTESSGR